MLSLSHKTRSSVKPIAFYIWTHSFHLIKVEGDWAMMKDPSQDPIGQKLFHFPALPEVISMKPQIASAHNLTKQINKSRSRQNNNKNLSSF